MHFPIKTFVWGLLSGSICNGSGIENCCPVFQHEKIGYTQKSTQKVSQKETPQEYRDRKIKRVVELNRLTKAEASKVSTEELESIIRRDDARRFNKRHSSQPKKDYSDPKSRDSKQLLDAEQLLKQADQAKQEENLVEAFRCCNEIFIIELVDVDTLYSCIELLVSINQRDELLKGLCQKILRKKELTSGKRLKIKITLIDAEADLEIKRNLVNSAIVEREFCSRPHLMLELGRHLLGIEEIFRDAAYDLLQQAGETSNDPKVIFAAMETLENANVKFNVCLDLAKRIKNPLAHEADFIAQLYLKHGRIDEAVEVFKGQSLSQNAVRFFPEWMASLISLGEVQRVIEIYKLVIRENQNLRLASKILNILKDLVFSEPALVFLDKITVLELLAKNDRTPQGQLNAMIEILKANRRVNFTNKHYDAFRHLSDTELNSFLKRLLEKEQIDESIEIVQRCWQNSLKIDALMYLATLPNLTKETKIKLYKKTELLVGLPEIKFQVVEALRSYGREHDDGVKNICLQIADDPEASYEDVFRAASILEKIDHEAAKAIYLKIADDPEASYEDIFKAASLLRKIDHDAAKLICQQIADDPDAGYEEVFQAASLLEKIDIDAAKAIYLQISDDPDASYEDVFRAASILEKIDPVVAKKIFLELANDKQIPANIKRSIINKGIIQRFVVNDGGF